MALDASKYVQYLEDWRVSICLHKRCRYCLMPNGVKRHFRIPHHDIYDLYTRQQIERYAQCRVVDKLILLTIYIVKCSEGNREATRRYNLGIAYMYLPI